MKAAMTALIGKVRFLPSSGTFAAAKRLLSMPAIPEPDRSPSVEYNQVRAISKSTALL